MYEEIMHDNNNKKMEEPRVVWNMTKLSWEIP